MIGPGCYSLQASLPGGSLVLCVPDYRAGARWSLPSENICDEEGMHHDCIT